MAVADHEPFFVARGSVLEPQSPARSNWNPKTLRGPAITGALARGVEQACPQSGLRPARASFELFRPARMAPSTVRTAIVRQGPRLVLMDAFLEQGDDVVARAHVLLLAESTNPLGQIWEPSEVLVPPPSDQPADSENRLYRSGGPWSAIASEHDTPRRKQVWQRQLALVEGEKSSPFVSTAIAADMTSLVIHWGDRGVEFINADASVALSRLPVGDGIGVAVTQRSAHDGISTGGATFFDALGPFGAASVAALANAHRTVAVGKEQRQSPAHG